MSLPRPILSKFRSSASTTSSTSTSPAASISHSSSPKPFRSTYTLDSRGHPDLSYTYSSPATTQSSHPAVPFNRCVYSRDAFGHGLTQEEIEQLHQQELAKGDVEAAPTSEPANFRSLYTLDQKPCALFDSK